MIERRGIRSGRRRAYDRRPSKARVDDERPLGRPGREALDSRLAGRGTSSGSGWSGRAQEARSFGSAIGSSSRSSRVSRGEVQRVTPRAMAVPSAWPRRKARSCRNDILDAVARHGGDAGRAA
jgi:hypothetical protein